jgi:hypothetical protein
MLMPRIRSIKPEHRAHRKVGPLSDREYRLWVSMMVEADDEGRFIADTAQLRAQTWPYHDITIPEVEAAVLAIAKRGSIRLYHVGKIRFGCFPAWREHQHPKYPKPSSNPPPRFPQRSPKAGGKVGNHWGTFPPGEGLSLEGLSKEGLTTTARYDQNGPAPVDNSRQRPPGSTKHPDALLSTSSERQPTKDEQLDALAQREGLTREELKAAADAIAKKTAARKRRP